MDIKNEPDESINFYAQYSKNEIPLVRNYDGPLSSTSHFEKHCNHVDFKTEPSETEDMCRSPNVKPFLEIQIDEVEVKMESPNTEENYGLRSNRLPEQVAQIKLNRVPFYARNFVCAICYDVFPTLVEQERHNSAHHQFFSRNSFERYTNRKIKRCRMRALENRLRKCGKCDYSSVKSSYMKKHQMIHSDEKAFKCRECVYSCTQLSTIKVHEMTHSGERPFKCDECEFSCIQISTFKRHKMIHSGEKPFKCDKCDYSCIQVNNFKRHTMIHSGEKPFKCKECEYSCISPGNMKKHKMIHSGDRPFKCEQCDYSCIQMNNLKRHKMTHSGEKSFKCDECDYSCIVSSNFKRHRKIHFDKKT